MRRSKSVYLQLSVDNSFGFFLCAALILCFRLLRLLPVWERRFFKERLIWANALLIQDNDFEDDEGVGIWKSLRIFEAI